MQLEPSSFATGAGAITLLGAIIGAVVWAIRAWATRVRARADVQVAAFNHDATVSVPLLERIAQLEAREKERDSEVEHLRISMKDQSAQLIQAEAAHERCTVELAAQRRVVEVLADELARREGASQRFEDARLALASIPSPPSSTVLLVDDDAEVLRALARMINALGRRCLCASTVASALVALIDPDVQIDLVIADVKMPGRSGVDLLSDMRKLRSRVPVLFITGAPEAAPPGLACLLKPITVEALSQAIGTVLEDTGRFRAIDP